MKSLVIVTGSSGFLGQTLTPLIRSTHRTIGVARSGSDFNCNLCDEGQVKRLLQLHRPTHLVHTAAISDLDYCERYPDQCEAANFLTLKLLLDHIPASCHVTFLSTIAVYPDQIGPHQENGIGPENHYGRIKLKAEELLRGRESSLILRTSMFGPSRRLGRHSLSDFIVDGLRSGEGADLFGDELFSPLHVASLAKLICSLLTQRATGLYNIGSRDGFSKYEFGLAVANHLGLDSNLVRPVNSRELAGRVKRGLDMRLDVRKFESHFNMQFRSLAEEIALL